MLEPYKNNILSPSIRIHEPCKIARTSIFDESEWLDYRKQRVTLCSKWANVSDS